MVSHDCTRNRDLPKHETRLILTTESSIVEIYTYKSQHLGIVSTEQQRDNYMYVFAYTDGRRFSTYATNSININSEALGH